MKLPTLNEFISQPDPWVRNSWVRELGFKSLYVRLSKRHLLGKWHDTLDIANVTAKRPGNGAFTRLVEKIRTKRPDLGIYVECVLQQRFRDKLVTMGFTPWSVDPNNFHLLREAKLCKQKYKRKTCIQACS